MRKLVMVFFAFCAISMGLMAQGEVGRRENGRREQRMISPEKMAERMTERQTERLKLSDEQKAGMQALNSAYVTKMRQPRPEMKDGDEVKKMSKEERQALRQASMERMKTIRAEYEAEVKKVLTPEQYAEFEKMQKERPQGNRPRGGRSDGQRGPRRGGFDRGPGMNDDMMD